MSEIELIFFGTLLFSCIFSKLKNCESVKNKKQNTILAQAILEKLYKNQWMEIHYSCYSIA